MLENTNVEIEQIKGLVYNLAKDAWYFSDDIDINYFMYLRKNDKPSLRASEVSVAISCK